MNGTGSLRSHPSPAASDGVRKRKQGKEQRAKFLAATLDPEFTQKRQRIWAKNFKRRVGTSPRWTLDPDFDEDL